MGAVDADMVLVAEYWDGDLDPAPLVRAVRRRRTTCCIHQWRVVDNRNPLDISVHSWDRKPNGHQRDTRLPDHAWLQQLVVPAAPHLPLPGGALEIALGIKAHPAQDGVETATVKAAVTAARSKVRIR